MATKGKANIEGSKEITGVPQSLAIAAQGVTTGEDFALLMSALMGDILAGRVDANTGNAVCRAGDKLLKVVEMRYRYGKQQAETSAVFRLVG